MRYLKGGGLKEPKGHFEENHVCTSFSKIGI